LNMEHDDTIVLFTSAELRRNISEYPFMSQISGEDLLKLKTVLQKSVADLGITLETASLSARKLGDLRNRRVLQPGDGNSSASITFDHDAFRWVLTTAEEHIQFFGRTRGADLEKSHQKALAWEKVLEKELNFAFSFDMGYLLRRVDETGTALFFEAMLYLPGICQEEDKEPIFRTIMEQGFEIEAFTGGREADESELFLLKNSLDLRMNEKEQLNVFAQLLVLIVHYERKARKNLLSRGELSLKDRVFRAWSLIAGAEMMSWEESLETSLSLYLGAYYGLTQEKGDELYQLLWRPVIFDEEDASGDERDQLRADSIRRTLGIKRIIGGENV
jgi:protein arginine kinase